jgi:hypothetical protein
VPNFDQRDQAVNKQVNIVGDVHVTPPPNPDPAALIRLGIAQLRGGAYLLATGNLRQALSMDPSIRRTYYHLSVALLKGRRPKLISRSEMREIDELLAAAIARDGEDGLFHWFRALLRDDYYNSNGLICPHPSVSSLTAAARAGRTDPGQRRTLLRDVQLTGNVLYSELVRQLA